MKCEREGCTRTIPNHQCQNTNLPLWTLDRAAKHFGLTIATVERYIRQGLPAYPTPLGRTVKPDELIAEVTNRRQRHTATRATA